MVTRWERADLLALVYVLFYCVIVTFPWGFIGQVWYLIVLVPDLYLLFYFVANFINLQKVKLGDSTLSVQWLCSISGGCSVECILCSTDWRCTVKTHIFGGYFYLTLLIGGKKNYRLKYSFKFSYTICNNRQTSNVWWYTYIWTVNMFQHKRNHDGQNRQILMPRILSV